MRSTPRAGHLHSVPVRFPARVNTVDDEGNTIEMTDEEKAAALEEAGLTGEFQVSLPEQMDIARRGAVRPAGKCPG